MKLRGKAALVTGASGGIGRAVAREFAREGASVAILHRDSADRARSVLGELEALGTRSALLRGDLSDPRQAREAVAAAVRELGRLDILACFHGAKYDNRTWFARFEDLPPEAFRTPLDVDLLGTVYLCQAAAAVMRAQRSGRIVLTASTPAITGDRFGVPYLVAKAGVLALTRALATILGPDGIRVNAMALGAVDTESMASLPPEAAEALARETALGRRGTPEEVARTAVFLASEDAAFLTGQTLVVDGGYAMR
jgi:3-oxoacyl-[acyl-carrier protein] reductase